MSVSEIAKLRAACGDYQLDGREVLIPYTDAELSAIERRGRQSIISSIPQMGIIESARANAAALLIPMIEQMRFQRDHITITCRQDFGPADLIKRLTRQTSEHGKARQ